MNTMTRTNRVWRLFVTCCLTWLSGCGLDTSITVNETAEKLFSSEILIELPQALLESRYQTSTKIVNDTPATPLTILRHYDTFLNSCINGSQTSIKTLIDSMITPLSWNHIKSLSSFDTTIGSLRCNITYQKADSLPFKISLTDTMKNQSWKMRLAFRLDPFKKGWIYTFHDRIPSLSAESLAILIHFSNNQNQKLNQWHIRLKSKGMSNFVAESFIYYLHEQNSKKQISATLYFPFLDSLIPNTKGHCITYKALSDSSQKKAIQLCAIPLASQPDTNTIFSDFKLFDMYCNAYLLYQLPLLFDTTKMMLATSSLLSLSIDHIETKIASDTSFKLLSAQETSKLTVGSIRTFLALNPSIQNSSIKKALNSLIQLKKFDQPLFCSDAGIITNGTNTIPKEFEILYTSAFTQQTIPPLQAKLLTIPIQ